MQFEHDDSVHWALSFEWSSAPRIGLCKVRDGNATLRADHKAEESKEDTRVLEDIHFPAGKRIWSTVKQINLIRSAIPQIFTTRRVAQTLAPRPG
jgi:hypothetical protein